MPAYEVKLSATGGQTLKNGHDVMTVFAEDGPDAIALASGQNDADGSWAGATATLIGVGTDLSPVTDAQGKTRTWVLEVLVAGGAAQTADVSFKHVCGAAETYAGAFAAMVVLLNANVDIANAAFAANVLTVADVADGIGDATVTASFSLGGSAIPSFLSTVTHEGVAAAALTIATNATPEIPKAIGSYRLR
jgi:hypothetical protein